MPRTVSVANFADRMRFSVYNLTLREVQSLYSLHIISCAIPATDLCIQLLSPVWIQLEKAT